MNRTLLWLGVGALAVWFIYRKKAQDEQRAAELQAAALRSAQLLRTGTPWA